MFNLPLDSLNPPQREAVVTIDGPVLVLAGAGSGKTRVITYRVAHLLERGVRPDAILAVSFTNKAAEEMRARVDKLLGARGRAAGKQLTLSTFHALGMNLLRAERKALNLPQGFTIYDGSDQLGVVRELLRRVQVDDRRFDSKALLFRISRAKNAFMTPAEYTASIMKEGKALDEYDVAAAEIFPRYEEALRQFHAFDFDDLITEAVRLLDRDEEVRARWANRFRYVMVDEYQDTNRAQFKLLEHLAGHHNLCVVGDDDQSIYGWRGAEAGHILEFAHHFPGARVVKLEENYRSTPHILDAANAVIVNNTKRHDKKLWTARPPGEKLQLVVCDDGEAEAKFIADEIIMLCATKGFRHKDCAVLYRSNVQSKLIEEALRDERIAHRVIGGQAFFDRKEVKDAIAYLKLALVPKDEIALRRVINYPARGIGATTIDKLVAFAAKHSIGLYDACRRAEEASLFDVREHKDTVEGLAGRTRHAVTAFCDLVEGGRALLHGALASGGLKEAARKYIESVGLPDDLRSAAASPAAAQKRLEHIDGFLDSLGRFEERAGRDLEGFLHRLTLQSKDEVPEGVDVDDEVTLVTLHGAKGLEFPVVFLVGLEEELLPHKRTLYPQGPDVLDATIDLGEERRLMYVGITRAQKRLYLTHARRRSQRAADKPRTRSRFLEEIPVELYDERESMVPMITSKEDEEAFARASLAKLFKMIE